METTDTTSRSPASPATQLSLRGAVFLGVGSMVGAGIFALLGEAGAVAGSAVWISFVLAGLISTLLGYTLVKLGVRYPSSGGLVTYLVQAFGNGRLVGVACWLGYFAAIVLVGAMVAVSFGDYAASLFLDADPGGGWSKFFAALVVVASAALTAAGAKLVDKAQSAIVVGLLAIFLVFVCATLSQLDPHLLAPSGYPSASSIIASVALTFFAYLGFAVISFAAGDIPDPRRNLPRAMYGSLGITTALYVAVSLGVFGTLTVSEVVGYGSTAIAEAARPVLGDAGFVAMAIAALLATSSSVTATFYASEGFTSALAEVRQFPPFFGAGTRLGRHGGLVVTTVATLLLALLSNLDAIASVGSAVSLLVFVLVALSGVRLREEIGAQRWLLALAVVASSAALVFFAIDTVRHDPATFIAMVALVAFGVGLDFAWKRIRDRQVGIRSAR